jgi:hypothetical protein
MFAVCAHFVAWHPANASLVEAVHAALEHLYAFWAVAAQDRWVASGGGSSRSPAAKCIATVSALQVSGLPGLTLPAHLPIACTGVLLPL